MKITIKIQSVSDIITNSSSEVFCIISSDTKLEAIKELLKPLFADEGDSDLYPSTYTNHRGELEIWLPYGMDYQTEFYKSGLVAILDKYFKDNYKIDWCV